MSRSKRFLRSFQNAAAGANPLAEMNRDWEGFGDALASAPEALKQAMEADAQVAPSGPAFVNPAAFASAACDRDGAVVVADSSFARWAVPAENVRAQLDTLKQGRPSVSFLTDGEGRFVAVAAASPDFARDWPLADAVRASLDAGKAAYAIIAHRLPDPARSGDLIAARVFGFTGLETRLTQALLAGGDVPQAARLAGVGYETAREAIKSAMRKAGARRQGGFISTCIALQSGEAAGHVQVAPILQDLFGLTRRQGQVAVTVATGCTRSEAAAALGLSENVVKAEMKAVFIACLVESVAALSAVVAQVRALAELAEATGVSLSGAAADGEPLRLLPRRGRAGCIAFSDHGPRSGLPVLILHTATTARHNPASHIRALQAHGLRPIALDRPGFGLSQMVEGDYLGGSADDLADILDALGLARAHFIARGGAMVLSRFGARHPGRIAGAVVINPEPPPHADRKRNGPTGHLKQLVYTRPGLIESLARHLSRRASAGIVEAVVLKALEASPADRRLLQDPELRAAYVRSTQQSALQGAAGFIAVACAEPAEQATPLADGSMITILCGAQDPMYDAADSLPRWQRVWPGCQVRIVADAGRLLHLQHPALLAQILKRYV